MYEACSQVSAELVDFVPELHNIMTMAAVDTAYQFLCDRIRATRSHGGDRLPPIAQLASDAGVAVVTMWRAVRRLCAEGALTAAPRAGIRLHGAAPPTASTATAGLHGPAARSRPSLRDMLARDLVAGRWPPGARLPGYKTMAHEYGAGYPRLRQTLEELVAEGRLHRHGRGFSIPRPESGVGGGTIVLLSGRPDLPSLAAITERVGMLCAVLESECSRRRVRLGTLQVPENRSAELVDRLRQAERSGPVLGYLLLSSGMSERSFETAVRALADAERQHAVMDPMGDQPMVRRYEPRRRGCLVTIVDHYRAGIRMGDFLQSKGHRRVVYLSPYVRFGWCRDRLHGLRRAFSDAGVLDGVHEVTEARLETYGEIGEWIMATRRFGSVRGHVSAIESVVDSLFGGARHELLDGHVLPAMVDRFIESRMLPLFTRALQDTAATAWVTTNDMVGLLALRFLASAGSSRRRIAVAGFDNIPQASLAGLTSYSFNVEGVVAGALDHILAPARAAALRTGRLVTVPGTIIPRGSTG